MQYVGGKASIGKHIINAILNNTGYREGWFEPFVGGANVTEYAIPHFTEYRCFDAHQDLILMWQAIKEGWNPPPYVTRAEYSFVRNQTPSALRGFVGFGCSFRGKWFGGYAIRTGNAYEDPPHTSYKLVMRKAKLFRKVDIEFAWRNFGTVDPPSKSVIYCDPPYRNTQDYSEEIEMAQYWYYPTLQRWARNECAVYCSEYETPTVPHYEVWSRSKRALLKGYGYKTERLFRIEPC